MSEINENSGNVNNLVPEESKAPVLNEPVTETIDNKVTDPQEPEITEPEKTKPEKQPGVIPAEKQDEQKPSGENKGDQKPRWQNKRERPKGDTIYSDARSIAVKILTRVERTDSYLDKLIDYEIRTDLLNDYDKSLLNEICHGVIRWMRRLDWFLNGFYRGNWEKCTPEIKNTLRVALYQILFLNKIPDFAAVNEAVEFVKRISTQKTCRCCKRAA